jgi:hypothetical protein
MFVSLFSNLFNKKKLDSKVDDRQTELEDNGAEGLEVNQSPSFELQPQRSFEETSDISEEEDIEYEVVEREIHPAKIICPDCGGITLEGLEFCDKCGGELL